MEEKSEVLEEPKSFYVIRSTQRLAPALRRDEIGALIVPVAVPQNDQYESFPTPDGAQAALDDALGKMGISKKDGAALYKIQKIDLVD